MAGRRSYHDLAYGDDLHEGGGRWDRDRFERVRARSRGPPPRGAYLDVEVDDRRTTRPRPRSAVFDDRYYEEERGYGPRGSFFETDERYRREAGGKELAPYRDRYPGDDYPPPRRVAERIVPRYEDGRGNSENVKIDLRIGDDHRRDDRRDDRRDERRDDRRDDRREEIRIEDRRDGRREDIYIDERFDDRYAPPRRYYDEPRYYRPPPPPIEPDWRDYEDYRDAKIVRERTIDRRAPSRPPDSYDERYSLEEEEKIEVKEEIKRPPGTKKGKTRMPKRLVHKRAIIEMGYPYDEEEDFYMVRLALGKEHIDECIKISERYREEEKTTYSYAEKERSETKAIEAPPPPPPQEEEDNNVETETTETVTRRIIENPTEEDLAALREGTHEAHETHDAEEHQSAHNSVEIGSNRDEMGSDHGSQHTRATHRSHRSRHGGHASVHDGGSDREEVRSSRSKSVVRSKSTARSKSRFRSKSRRRRSRFEEDGYSYEDDREESGTITGPLGLVISPSRGGHHHHDRERERQRERDIKAEIRDLEDQKRRLREEIHEDDDEVRVEKDRRGRLNLVRSARD